MGNPALCRWVRWAARTASIENVGYWFFMFRAIKISEFGFWVERHNGDHVFTYDLWWRHRWSKGGTIITHACDKKHHIGNTVISVRMSKSVNTNLFRKSILLNIVNRHKGVIAQAWTDDIKIKSVRWVCGIHGYFMSVKLFKVRVSPNLKHFQWLHLRRRPVTRC